MGLNRVILRKNFLKAYDSIHDLTLSKWFYEDYSDDEIWKDKRLWVHLSCVLICQSSVLIFKIIHLLQEDDFFAALISLTGLLVILLVAIRTYTLYQIPTFRRLYFKPEIFNCNKHRPISSLTYLIKTVKYSRKVGLWCVGLFVMFDVSLLVLPLVPPIMEAIGGTNKTYDELIPQYPSVNPVKVSWKEIKYAWDLVMAVVNTIPWVGFVIVYYTVVQTLRAQHKILMASMQRGSKFPEDATEPLELKLWIEDHVLLRKLVFDLRRTVSPALAGTVGANVFTVGLNMLALISSPIGPGAPIFVKCLYYFSYLMYSAVSILDIFIHCWLASEITNCGEELRTAIYEADWYKNLMKPHQDYVLPLMICSKPIRMTALGMVPVTLQTFTETIRLAYSYYTLLMKTSR